MGERERLDRSQSAAMFAGPALAGDNPKQLFRDVDQSHRNGQGHSNHPSRRAIRLATHQEQADRDEDWRDSMPPFSIVRPHTEQVS